MPLMQLALGLAHHAIHHAAALYGGALGDFFGPALYIFVFLHLQKLTRLILQPHRQRAVPSPHGHVGDGVVVADQIAVVRQTKV